MERKLLFTEQASKGDGVAIMLLNRQIGTDPKKPHLPFIDGSAFAEEMYYHKASGRKVLLKINSVGGNVVQGWNIVDAVESTEADTHLIGLGASMAGVIYLSGKKKTSEPYGTLMLHSAHGGSDRYREIINAQFRNLLTTKTKLPAEKIEAILAEGDHFFDVSDMVNFGLLDEAPATVKRMFTQPSALSVDELFEIYNSLNEKNNNKTLDDMSIFATLFGGKDEQETIAKAVSAKAENDRLKSEMATKEAELEAMKTKMAELEKNANAQKAVALIDDAIAKGKLQNIKAEDKAKLIENATANYDTVKLMLDGVQVTEKKKVSSVSASIDTDSKEKVTYEYLAKNDPDKLVAIMESEPELYARLEKEYLEAENAKRVN